MVKLFNIKIISQTLVCTLLLASCSDDNAVDSRGQTALTSNNSDVQSQNSEDVVDTESALSQLNNQNASVISQSTDSSQVDATDQQGLENQVDENFNSFDYQPTETLTFSEEQTTGVIRWQAPENVDYTNATVTISDANGDSTSKSFKAGEPIELYGNLPDGVYSWESVITPELSDYVKEQMREVRESGDFQAERELVAQLRADGALPTKDEVNANRQSGSFIVLDGVVRPSRVDDPVSNEDNGK